MTPEQISLARHALGLPNQRRISYRKYFVAGPGHDDYDNWLAMVENGDATKRPGGAIAGGDDIFYLTLAGAKKALKAGESLSLEDFP